MVPRLAAFNPENVMQPPLRRLLRTGRFSRGARKSIHFGLAQLAALALCAVPQRGLARTQASGLRWLGDARLATDAGSAATAGAVVRFRYGKQLYAPTPHISWHEAFVGNWAGAEVSAGLLSGTLDGSHAASLGTLGIRLWLSQRQPWFLRNERFSTLSVMLPEFGVMIESGARPRPYLGWEIPLGGKYFQVVPGLLWRPTIWEQNLFATLAFRVPM